MAALMLLYILALDPFYLSLGPDILSQSKVSLSPEGMGLDYWTTSDTYNTSFTQTL